MAVFAGAHFIEREQMNITPRDDGRFEVGDRIFQSEAEAKAFADGASTGDALAKGGQAKTQRRTPVWANVLALLVVGYVAVSCFGGGNKPPASASTSGVTYEEALRACQSSIKRANGGIREVPRTQNRGSGGEFVLLWDNANPGGSPAVEASCTVNRQTGRVTSLTLNGKSVM
jgi:hypothetical protein